MSDSTDRLIQQLLLNKSDEDAKKALISTLKRESHSPKECYATLSTFKDNYETIDEEIKKLEEKKKLLEEKHIENQKLFGDIISNIYGISDFYIYMQGQTQTSHDPLRNNYFKVHLPYFNRWFSFTLKDINYTSYTIGRFEQRSFLDLGIPIKIGLFNPKYRIINLQIGLDDLSYRVSFKGYFNIFKLFLTYRTPEEYKLLREQYAVL